MPMLNREGYKGYLQHRQLSANTINIYCTGLGKISDHYGTDIFTITDTTLLQQIASQYGLAGEYSEIGRYGNGSARNALKYWIEYVSREEGDDTTDSKDENICYLFAVSAEQLSTHTQVTLPATARALKEGTPVYLLRTQQNQRGIVARGIITSSKESGTCCEIDDVRSDCASGMVPLVLVYKAAQGFGIKWPQLSDGFIASEQLNLILENLWLAGSGKHSLKQYVEWSQEDLNEQQSGWFNSYKKCIEEIASLRNDPARLNDATLSWIWQQSENGICSVRPGALPEAEFKKNITFLEKITHEILAAPDTETRDKVFEQWESEEFSKNRYAVINRVFSTASPERYTTIVKDDNCIKLLIFLRVHFALEADTKGNWISLNNNLKKLLSATGVSDETPLQNNIALWQLFQTIDAMKGIMQQLTEHISNNKHSAPGSARNTHSIPLNQILFGPPGSGKTWATVNHAIAILEPELLATNAERHQLKIAFDHYVAEGQIVFTTFHQSYSYEDFVEGIRAVTNDGHLEYRVEAGVFRSLCEQAKSGFALSEDPFEKSLKALQEKLAQSEDECLTMETVRGKTFSVRQSGSQNFLALPDASEGGLFTIKPEYIKRLYLAGENSVSGPSYTKGILNYLKSHCGLSDIPASPAPGNKFVLIIDEINRGNISRIFGELITLIEPSKRAGSGESLPVTLPYSKESFSVPDNVYLIGTMNTSDRSLAGMDIALRRRFVFSELMPKPELLDNLEIDNINIGELLRTMNLRIEVLLDRDHLIGHAYFMPLISEPTLKHLASIFSKQILPLLQEYFFEDWQRIQWVLNDHRKAIENRILTQPDENFSQLFGDIVPHHGKNVRWQINHQAFTTPAAYLGIINTAGTTA